MVWNIESRRKEERKKCMNLCILSGRIVSNATVRGEDPKALSFIVETVNKSNGSVKKDMVNCVLFKPTPELEAQLTSEGEGLYIEAEGRVSSSSLKANGEKRYNSDVIIRAWTLSIVNQREDQP
jgi:single-stranded DNA-binding protein